MSFISDIKIKTIFLRVEIYNIMWNVKKINQTQ